MVQHNYQAAEKLIEESRKIISELECTTDRIKIIVDEHTAPSKFMRSTTRPIVIPKAGMSKLKIAMIVVAVVIAGVTAATIYHYAALTEFIIVLHAPPIT